MRRLKLLFANGLNPIVVAAHLGAARGEDDRLRFDGFFRFTQRGLAFAPVITKPDAFGLLQFAGEAGVVARALCLAFHRTHARPDFGQDVAHAFQVVARLVEFPQRIFAFVAIERDARGFFEQRAALVGVDRQRLIDHALADDSIGAARQPGLGEQFAHIAQAHFAAVEQVFILAIAIGAAAHNHFVELDREEAIRVVEREVHFGHARARTAIAAGEDQVFGLLRSQSREDLFAQDPAQAVGHVRFARSIRADDGRDAGGEDELRFGRKGLEPLHFEMLQSHSGGIVPCLRAGGNPQRAPTQGARSRMQDALKCLTHRDATFILAVTRFQIEKP